MAGVMRRDPDYECDIHSSISVTGSPYSWYISDLLYMSKMTCGSRSTVNLSIGELSGPWNIPFLLSVDSRCSVQANETMGKFLRCVKIRKINIAGLWKGVFFMDPISPFMGLRHSKPSVFRSRISDSRTFTHSLTRNDRCVRCHSQVRDIWPIVLSF